MRVVPNNLNNIELYSGSDKGMSLPYMLPLVRRPWILVRNETSTIVLPRSSLNPPESWFLRQTYREESPSSKVPVPYEYVH